MAKEPFQRFDTCRDFAAALSHGGVGFTSPTDDTQLATNIPAPFREGTNREQIARSGSDAASISRRTALIVSGIRLVSRGSGRVHRCAPGTSAISATDRIAASAEFNIVSIAATGTATDGDIHSTPRDRHPTRCTADHHHPTSHNARTNTAVR